ncbi:TPA: ATP-binding protein [Acinetobacter baumannii]|nr:ATP-binding protein [Acinetobacter baumannii]
MSLSELVESPSQINILIGENGQGKTRLLDNISIHFKDKKNNLIIINNPRGKNLVKRSSKFLIPTHKTNDLNSLVNKMIKKTFTLLENNRYTEVESQFNKIARMLNYLGFESRILFTVRSEILEKDFISDYYDFDGDYDESHVINSLIDYLDIEEDNQNNKYICIDFEKDIYGDIENSIRFLYLIKYYWREKIVTNLISVKSNLILTFNHLSSGEKNILLTIFFISISLSDRRENVLIIDEPEISLHPKWQIEYLENISDLFYLNDIKIYIATHSPLLLTDLFFNKSKRVEISFSIFHVEYNNIKLLEEESEKSIEAIYWNIFGVLTPQSSFLSRKITDLLNKLTLGEISLDEVVSKLNIYIDASYDFNQSSTLKELRNQIIENSQKLEKGID